MRINYNESAILANACLNRTDSALAASIERLSSGLKINHAKDNPAGLAISNRMNAQIKGLSQASDNTNDGISVVETADGALGEVSSIIQRMSELSVQAGNDVTTDSDRELINDEIRELKEEVTRIAGDTQFNGQNLLDGTFDYKAYSSSSDIKVEYYSDEVKTGKYQLYFQDLIDSEGNVDTALLNTYWGFDELKNIEATAELPTDDKDGLLTIKADGNIEIKISYKESADFADLNLSGIGPMKIQIGANEGQELDVRIPEISLERMGIEDLDTSTFESAQAAIKQVQGALEYVNKARANLGAYENRMEHNESNLSVSEENMTSSYSRIMDVDMAEEMTEYSTQQVLTQSGISMLSQANERPEQVLQLLQ